MLKLNSIILIIIFSSCARAQELKTADDIDINRYIGKWYAITSLPQFFTRKCLGQSADYQIINESAISVLNTCYKKNKTTTIEGQAVVINFQTKAELEVSFNNFFTRLFRVKGDYNIIKIDENYQYVMVGSRDRKSLWIMARNKSMPEIKLKEYIEIAKEQGFPIERLVRSKYEKKH
ncbi:MAG: lipocalin family protein [Bacteriovoracaceae bacterium]|nr:lipocalin family protein [Bacteriovoracaceae bacterium]